MNPIIKDQVDQSCNLNVNTNTGTEPTKDIKEENKNIVTNNIQLTTSQSPSSAQQAQLIIAALVKLGVNFKDKDVFILTTEQIVHFHLMKLVEELTTDIKTELPLNFLVYLFNISDRSLGEKRKEEMINFRKAVFVHLKGAEKTIPEKYKVFLDQLLTISGLFSYLPLFHLQLTEILDLAKNNATDGITTNCQTITTLASRVTLDTLKRIGLNVGKENSGIYLDQVFGFLIMTLSKKLTTDFEIELPTEFIMIMFLAFDRKNLTEQKHNIIKFVKGVMDQFEKKKIPIPDQLRREMIYLSLLFNYTILGDHKLKEIVKSANIKFRTFIIKQNSSDVNIEVNLDINNEKINNTFLEITHVSIRAVSVIDCLKNLEIDLNERDLNLYQIIHKYIMKLCYRLNTEFKIELTSEQMKDLFTASDLLNDDKCLALVSFIQAVTTELKKKSIDDKIFDELLVKFVNILFLQYHEMFFLSTLKYIISLAKIDVPVKTVIKSPSREEAKQLLYWLTRCKIDFTEDPDLSLDHVVFCHQMSLCNELSDKCKVDLSVDMVMFIFNNLDSRNGIRRKQYMIDFFLNVIKQHIDKKNTLSVDIFDKSICLPFIFNYLHLFDYSMGQILTIANSDIQFKEPSTPQFPIGVTASHELFLLFMKSFKKNIQKFKKLTKELKEEITLKSEISIDNSLTEKEKKRIGKVNRNILNSQLSPNLSKLKNQLERMTTGIENDFKIQFNKWEGLIDLKDEIPSLLMYPTIDKILDEQQKFMKSLQNKVQGFEEFKNINFLNEISESMQMRLLQPTVNSEFLNFPEKFSNLLVEYTNFVVNFQIYLNRSTEELNNLLKKFPPKNEEQSLEKLLCYIDDTREKRNSKKTLPPLFINTSNSIVGSTSTSPNSEHNTVLSPILSPTRKILSPTTPTVTLESVEKILTDLSIEKDFIIDYSIFHKVNSLFSVNEFTSFGIKANVSMPLKPCGLEIFLRILLDKKFLYLGAVVPPFSLDGTVSTEQSIKEDNYKTFIENNLMDSHDIEELCMVSGRFDRMNNKQKSFINTLNYGVVTTRYFIKCLKKYSNKKDEEVPRCLYWCNYSYRLSQKMIKEGVKIDEVFIKDILKLYDFMINNYIESYVFLANGDEKKISIVKMMGDYLGKIKGKVENVLEKVKGTFIKKWDNSDEMEDLDKVQKKLETLLVNHKDTLLEQLCNNSFGGGLVARWLRILI